MNTTAIYNVFASAHLDGTILMQSIRIGILGNADASGVPLASYRVTAGVQTHPAYAIARAAIKVFAYAEAAKRFDIETIQVNLRANLISAETVTVLVSDGDIDIEWHGPSEVRNAAEFTFARLTSGKANAIPQDWPTTPMTLPISKPAVVRRR
jgi:hypothetical protein